MRMHPDELGGPDSKGRKTSRDPMEDTQRRLALRNRIKAPQCPYCGDIAPPNTHGDAYFQWMGAHIDSRIHRIWWKVYKPFKKGRK